MSVAIVVNAYNRPAALARLLASLQQAVYPADGPVPLIISIDRGGSHDVRTLADDFVWPHGPCEVIVQEQHLGLVQHFFACGDLTRRHDALIYLEDDLTISPVFFAYASQALSFYQHSDQVEGLHAATVYAAGRWGRCLFRAGALHARLGFHAHPVGELRRMASFAPRQ